MLTAHLLPPPARTQGPAASIAAIGAPTDLPWSFRLRGKRLSVHAGFLETPYPTGLRQTTKQCESIRERERIGPRHRSWGHVHRCRPVSLGSIPARDRGARPALASPQASRDSGRVTGALCGFAANLPADRAKASQRLP
jgi:hypothetical protein